MFKRLKTYLCYMHHPAHFHLLKNTIINLKNNGHNVIVVCQKKDILEDLLNNAGIKYLNFLPRGRKNNKISMLYSLVRQDILTMKICLQNRPDLMFGTSGEICHIGSLLNIPSIYLNEDDIDVVPLLKYIVYPFAKHILTPSVCNNQRWEYKSIKYESYHELSYLHPNHFTPDIDVVRNYISTERPYFLIRFAKLTAHHDHGIRGITSEIAKKILELLLPVGNVYITSERELEPEFEPYRLAINPLDIHHVMAYADLYIGDSQTMAVEAGVLGTPFIRYNDFVGRISILDELENKYELGYGIKPDFPEQLVARISELVNMSERKQIFIDRKKKMLLEKIDYADFLVSFIENYPESLKSHRSKNE